MKRIETCAVSGPDSHHETPSILSSLRYPNVFSFGPESRLKFKLFQLVQLLTKNFFSGDWFMKFPWHIFSKRSPNVDFELQPVFGLKKNSHHWAHRTAQTQGCGCTRAGLRVWDVFWLKSRSSFSLEWLEWLERNHPKESSIFLKVFQLSGGSLIWQPFSNQNWWHLGKCLRPSRNSPQHIVFLNFVVGISQPKI